MTCLRSTGAELSYDRRAFEVRANLHYESAEEDAAYIANQVVLMGKSRGWSSDPDEALIASRIETILAPFNIGLVEPHTGTWGHHPGGTKFFSSR